MQTDQPRLSEAVGMAPAEKVTAAEEAAVIGAAPGQMRVIKRNGAVVPYDQSKISIAITKAYLRWKEHRPRGRRGFTSPWRE